MAVLRLPYTKTMIDLIHQIRRRMPLEFKPGVRFSNPDIFKTMTVFYFLTRDEIAKQLIAQLLKEVGGSQYGEFKTLGSPVNLDEAS